MNPGDFGFLIGDVSRLLRRTFRQQQADMGLTFEQVRALVHISRREGIRQVDLADLLDVQPITLVHQIDQLAANGLVGRRADPADRRAYQLFLTKAAIPHLSTIKKISAAIHADMFRGLDKEQVANAIAILSTVRENLVPK